METFGINFHTKNTVSKRGIVKITVPKYNKEGNISYFEEVMAKFTLKGKKIVPVNDDLGSFSDDALDFLYNALFGKIPVANKVKILPRLSIKNVKFE